MNRDRFGVAELGTNKVVLAIRVSVVGRATFSFALATAAEKSRCDGERKNEKEGLGRLVEHGEGLTGEPSRLKARYWRLVFASTALEKSLMYSTALESEKTREMYTSARPTTTRSTTPRSAMPRSI